LVVTILLLGCGSTAVPPNAEEPRGDANASPKVVRKDAAAVSPDAGSAADAGSDAEDPGGVGSASCDETPARRPGVRPVVRVDVELTYAGKPFEFGQPVALTAGTLTLTTFRFYLSELALLRPDGQVVPVNLVGADGTPVSYDTHLAAAEEPAGMTFRLAAPAGDYAGLSFRFGLSPACDQMNPSTSKPPLTFSSQMDWPGPFGYLFMRYGSRLEGVPPGEGLPTTIHMGGFPGMVFAPRVTAPGNVTVGATGGGVRLRVAIDELLRAARMPAKNEGPILPPTGGGVAEGDAVRQHAGMVSLFSLAPGP
jgi:hypothetical protein